LRGGGDEHLADGSADTAKRVPVDGSRGAAAGTLRTKFSFFEVGLFDTNVFPIHVEFIGENHR